MAEINYINGYEIADAQVREVLDNIEETYATITQLNNEATTRSNADANLQTQINSLASGSPKGVYATTSALISANPETGVYIITNDGHIYSWTHDGSTPVDLGVYQATEIADNSVSQPKTTFIPIDTNSIEHNYYKELTAQHLGYCYRSNGNTVSGNYITYSIDKDDFNVKDYYYKLNGYHSITFWDDQDVYISGVGQNLNTSYFRTFSDADVPNDYDHAIISIIEIDTTNYRMYKFPYSGVHEQKTWSNDVLALFTEQYNVDDNTIVDDNNILNLDGLKIKTNTTPISRLLNAKLNTDGNLLELDKFVLTNSYYDTINHTFHSYSGGGLFMFTSDELDTTNNQYRIDTNYFAYFYNSDKEQIGYETGSSLNLLNWKTVTFPENWAYVVFSLPYYVSEGKKGVFGKTTTTKHGDISKYDVPDVIPDTSSLKVATSNLNNKKGIFFGDSWCAGNSSYTNGWCRYLNNTINTFTPQNCGRNGADWSQGYTYWFDGTHGDVINQDYDYVIIEAYTNGLYVNESELLKQLGTIDEYTFYNDLTEMHTALGNTYAYDLERFIFTICNKYAGKKIGLMFPYKSVAMMNENNAFRKFREQVIKCANKYNIPIFDNFNGCNIPARTQTQIDEYFFHQPGQEHGDGVHLNDKGYKLIGNPIYEWINRL